MKPKQITVPKYAEKTGFDVIQIYAMIDENKLKSTKTGKGKRTMILL